MAVLKRKAVNLNYEVVGDSGPWVSLINGYTRPGTDFRMLAKHLANAGFQVLYFDNRGAGKTEAFGTFSLADMAEDVCELWRELGIENSHVLGISMGGIIAQVLSQMASIRSLVLVSSTASQQYLSADRGWPESLEGIEEKLSSYFDEGFYERNKLLVSMMAKNILEEISGQEFLSRAQAQSHAIRSYQWDARCPAKLPLLVLHGTADRIIPVQAAYDIQSLYPWASLTTFDDCGHLLLAENLKGLVTHVSEFWS